MCIYEHNIHNDKKAEYFLQKRGIASECILFPVVLCLCIGVKGFPDSSVGKESTCNAGNMGSISRSRDSLEEGNGNPLLYSCLENSMDRGAWWVTVHEVAKSWTQLSD